MPGIIQKLASPNLWVALGFPFALAGVAILLHGFSSEDEGLIRLGGWLLAPVLIGGILLVDVLIPALAFFNRKFCILEAALAIVVASALGIAAFAIGFYFTAGGHGWFTPFILSLFNLPNYPLICVGWVSNNRRLSRTSGWYALVAAIVMALIAYRAEVSAETRTGSRFLQAALNNPHPIIVIWAMLYFGQQIAGVLLLARRVPSGRGR
jgi:hypothetical protein